MWLNMLMLDGVINKTDGSSFNSKEFHELLSSNGYEFEGGQKLYSKEELIVAAERISNSLDNSSLQAMIIQNGKQYENGDTIESLEDVLIYNTGTGAFSNLFTCWLFTDLLELYEKYAHTYWTISDDFESILGRKMVERIKLITENQ